MKFVTKSILIGEKCIKMAVSCFYLWLITIKRFLFPRKRWEMEKGYPDPRGENNVTMEAEIGEMYL